MSEYKRYYVPGGTYFFTVVTYKRFPFFRSKLAIDLLRQSWITIESELPFKKIALRSYCQTTFIVSGCYLKAKTIFQQELNESKMDLPTLGSPMEDTKSQ